MRGHASGNDRAPGVVTTAPGPWTLRHVERPDLAWYRDLYRRVGEEWLWYSRIQAADDKLAARLHHPLVETHALVADGRDEGLLELDFRERETCEIGMFGVTAKLVGTGAAHWLMQQRSRLHGRGRSSGCGCTPAASITRQQSRLPGAGFRPFRLQIEIDDDPRLDGSAPRDVARHVPVIE